MIVFTAALSLLSLMVALEWGNPAAVLISLGLSLLAFASWDES